VSRSLEFFVCCLGVGLVGGGGGATIVMTVGQHCCMQLHALMSSLIADGKSKSSLSQVHHCVRGIGDCWVGVIAVGGMVGVTSIVAVSHHCCMHSHALAIASSSNE